MSRGTRGAPQGHARGTAPDNHRALIQTRWRSGSGGRLPLRCPCAAPASCCAAAPIDPTSPGEEPLVPPADHDPDALDVLDTSFRLLVAGPSPLAIDGAALGKGLPARLIPLDQLRALLLDRGTPYAARDAAAARSPPTASTRSASRCTARSSTSPTPAPAPAAARPTTPVSPSTPAATCVRCPARPSRSQTARSLAMCSSALTAAGSSAPASPRP